MQEGRKRGFGLLPYWGCCLIFGVYFAGSAIQGDYGLFQRVAAETEIRTLTEERNELLERIAVLRHRTERLSEDFIDADLLDEQLRANIGLARADEVVLR